MDRVAADRVNGCVLGLALGDALGAPFEGGVLERSLWRVLGRTRAGGARWTDDTQMAIDVVESLLARGGVDQDDLARRFAASYRWSRGYGPGTAKLLKRIARGENWREANRSVFRGGSWGNGAAMRSPILGIAYARRPAELDAAVRDAAIVTHAHELAAEGALCIARATAAAARGTDRWAVFRDAASVCTAKQFVSRLMVSERWLEAREDVQPGDAARELGNGTAAHESCVTSLYAAVRFYDRPFAEMLRFIATCRGDVDTIGAMAGAIWGAANGAAALPADALHKLEQRERLTSLAASLHERYHG